MAENVTVARPYAEAAFGAAREAGALDAWSSRLQRLALVAEAPEMTGVLGNPNLSAEQAARFFISFFEDKDAVFDNFVRELAEHERLSLLPEIAELFAASRATEAGVKKAVVETAFALSDADLQSLQPKLEAHFKSNLELSSVVDTDLIGGIRVVVGDQVLDASVRGKLETLATTLKN